MVNMPRQPIALFSLIADPAENLKAGKTRPEVYYLRHLAEALAQVGWQVDLFTLGRSPGEPAQVYHAPHCRTVRLPGPDRQALQDFARTGTPPHWDTFLGAFQQFQAKEGGNYPLIHTSDWVSGHWGLHLKQAHNVQWVHTAYGTAAGGVPVASLGAAIPSPGEPEPGADTIRGQIWAAADRIIVTVPQDSQPQWRPLQPKTAPEIIPSGTDIHHFHSLPQSQARQTLGLDPQVPIVLYVGQIAPHKGLETLAESCAQLRDRGVAFQLIIVGEEVRQGLQERDRLEGTLQRLNLSHCTQFAGYVNHGDLPLYYAAADVCVIPSYYEPFGWVAIESMACGTPVVASQVGGLALTIAHEATGLLVPPRDASALAAGMERVLTDPAWAARLRQSSTDRALEFSWSRVAAQVSDLYRRLLAQSLTGQGGSLISAA